MPLRGIDAHFRHFVFFSENMKVETLTKIRRDTEQLTFFCAKNGCCTFYRFLNKWTFAELARQCPGRRYMATTLSLGSY